MQPPREIVGIIPACGRATRLAPYPCPKELFPIGWQDREVRGVLERRPKVVSHFLVESMLQAEPSAIYFVVGAGKEELMAYYVPPAFPPIIAHVYRETTPSMVHTLDAARHWTEGATVLFGMPDTIVEPKSAFQQLLSAHQKRRAVLTLGLFTTGEPHRFGMVAASSEGRITSHVDKPASTELTTMWGIAVWEPQFTALLHELASDPRRSDREVVFGDAIDRALNLQWSVHGVHFADGLYIDVGSYTGITQALKRYSI